MKAPPHPGLAVRDELDELGLSIAEAAEGLGVARQTLHRLVSGDSGISPEMAYRLEQGIGSNADFWLKLQANYDLAEVRRHAGGHQRPPSSSLTDRGPVRTPEPPEVRPRRTPSIGDRTELDGPPPPTPPTAESLREPRPRPPMYLGIDLGTSSVKIVLVDGREALMASAEIPLAPSRPHPSRPRPSWSEGDPDAWWDAVASGLDRIRADRPAALARTEAIGLSGQMHGALLLDAADRPVRPAVLWNDGRAAAEARALAARHPELAATAGVRPMPGFTGPILAWLRAHEPDALGRARHLLLPKDWLRLKLTGERATDPSDAAGTWLLDQGARAWSPALAFACGVDPAWLPRVVGSTAVSGALRPDLAARWGLRPGLPVAGGGGDTAVGGVGIGAVEPGRGFVSLGTSGQLFLASDAYAPPLDPTVQGFCHALPGRWCRVAALLNGASPLAAAARWTGRPDVAALLAEVEAGFRGPSPLLALPYLAGERTPHDDPDARGAIVGLTGATNPADIAQAVMEAVAFSLADGLAALAPDVRPAALGFIGGGARSRLWGRMIASVLGTTLERHEGGARGPAFGAARLARLAATGEDPGAVAVPPRVADVIPPEPRLADAYAPRLAAFRSLYAALKGEFARPG